MQVEIACRGNELTIKGDPDKISIVKKALNALWEKVQKNEDIDNHIVDSVLRFLTEPSSSADQDLSPSEQRDRAFAEDAMSGIITKKRKIEPRTPSQKDYIDGMKRNQLTFGIGPAGTGKTYLAIAMAVSMMERGEVERIILSRPAVEAGERLGFLPGEMKEKMDPYMRPLYDALQDTMYSDKMMKKIASEEIEIAPLAFMRGRSLNNAFIILDEAQNTSSNQMLMFLTRMGSNARMVITGDPGQIDLPKDQSSGLIEAEKILTGVEGISINRFTAKDIVRSKIVGRIVDAYDKNKNK